MFLIYWLVFGGVEEALVPTGVSEAGNECAKRFRKGGARYESG